MADPPDPKPPAQPTEGERRAARRAELLRQNLRRRKAGAIRPEKPGGGGEKPEAGD